MNSSFRYMVSGTLGKAETDLDRHKHLMELVKLDDASQTLVFKLLWQSFKNVIRDRVLNREPVLLPFIGKLHISNKNKYALILKLQIAKDLGYSSWNEIPIDKLDDATELLKSKLYKPLSILLWYLFQSVIF